MSVAMLIVCQLITIGLVLLSHYMTHRRLDRQEADILGIIVAGGHIEAQVNTLLFRLEMLAELQSAGPTSSCWEPPSSGH